MSDFIKLVFALSALGAATAAAEPYTVVALASEAKAVVLAAPDGSLQRYRSGERLADTPWRVVDVRANEAVFARALPGRGGALNVGVPAGATVDFAALDRRHGTPPAPQPDLDVRLIPLPKR